MSPLKPLTKNEKLKEENTTEDKKALHSILSLFLILGKGFRELCHYRCHKAIDFFSEVSSSFSFSFINFCLFVCLLIFISNF